MIRNLLLMYIIAGILSLCWVTVCGATLNLECGESFKYCPEQRVNITCAVYATVVMRWIIEYNNTESILFFTSNDHVGDVPKHKGPFIASVIKRSSRMLESALWFTFKEELNNATVKCERVDVHVLDSCSVFSHDLPETVKEVTTHVNGCDTVLSWTRPSLHPSYANITNFTVMLVPEILPTQRVQNTQISLTLKLDGTSYTASIQACNCAGCGTKYVQEIAQNNYTSINDIINELTISGQLCHRLHNPEDDTVTIEFTWEKLQCALTYMVSIVNFSDRKLIELETESNSLNISSLKKGSIYQVCVVGVNGFFKGHCLKPLIIDLKVPESVHGLNISGLKFNSSSVALSLEWMCTSAVPNSRGTRMTHSTTAVIFTSVAAILIFCVFL